MPRIFKGSGSTLRLLIHKCVNYNALGNLKVVLYTTNPEIAVQVTEGIVVEGNRVVFTLPSTAFASMDDGVINYIIEGIIDNDFFSTERQSDYYLKTPTSYIAEGGTYQEKYLNINENGLYEVIPDEGKDAMTKVSVNVDIQPNLGHLYADFEDCDGEGNYWRYGGDDGFDGFNYVKINASAYGEQKRSEGYDQGHSDGRNDGIELGKVYAAEDAIILDITGNGTYYTKYAELPEWTEPLTGDDFYSYAYLNGISFNTGYVGDENTVIEIWYQPTSQSSTYGCIVGKQPVYGGEVDKIFKINKYMSNSFTAEYGGKSHTFTLNDGEWYHLKLSYADGLVVNGEQIATFSNPVVYSDVTFYINSNSADQRSVNGYFGMVKIDDNVYIPTETGYINRNTGEPLEVYTSGEYTFYPVEKPAQLDNLIKQVNVTVPIKAYDAKTGLNLSFPYSNMTAIPDYINFEGKTNWYKCFENCKNLTDISILKNIKINNGEQMFNACGVLSDVSTTDTWDFSDCTNLHDIFYSTRIADMSVSSFWNTSKVTNMAGLLQPSVLETVGTLDCTSIGSSFSNSPMYFCSSKLKNVGGFLNIKSSLDSNYASPSLCPNLTRESYINIFNGLYDFTGNGVTPGSNQGKIKLHSNAYDFLTDDDMAIAINKGWTITA